MSQPVIFSTLKTWGVTVGSPCSASISHFFFAMFVWLVLVSWNLVYGSGSWLFHIFFLRPFDTSPRASCSSISVSLYLSRKPHGTSQCQDLAVKSRHILSLPEALCHRHYVNHKSSIVNHPSIIIHCQSSINHHLSWIINHPWITHQPSVIIIIIIIR